VSGLSNGLVAHWTFDGQKLLQNVADSTGSGNHGRLISFPATSTAVVSGPIGQALKFDGVNDGIWTQTHAFGSKPQGTATFWFKALAYGGGEFIYEDGNSYNNFSAALGSGATDPLLFYLGSNSNTVTTTKSNFLLGEWYHVAITWNGTNTITYVDGVLDKSNVRSNVPNTTAGLETQLGRTAYGSPVSPTVGNYFKGTMDDVRVYNRALSATEIKRLYELGATTHVAVTPQSGLAAVTQASGLSNGLVAHWTFDGPKLLQNATDSSGTGNTGRLIGFTSTTTTLGPIGQALTFDGSNDYITIGDQASLESLSAITVSAWVKPNQLAADAVIAGKGVVASIVWQLWQDDVGSVSGRTDEYSFAVGSGGGTLSRAEGATNSVVAGKWTHVVGVWEQSPEHVYIYVDGVLSQSDTSLQSLTMPNTSSAVRIGDDLTDGTNAYSGSMDDVRVYNRALSAAEVLRLYQLGK
jgi:hypothetical protein